MTKAYCLTLQRKILSGVLLAMLSLFALPAFSDRNKREFSFNTPDGAAGQLVVSFKPQGCWGEKGYQGCYYYLLTLRPKQAFTGETNGIGCPKYREDVGAFTRVELRFYDADGFSLYSTGYDNYLAPGWNENADETTQVADGWQWRGRFSEARMTLPNFLAISAVKATLGKNDGCIEE